VNKCTLNIAKDGNLLKFQKKSKDFHLLKARQVEFMNEIWK
jgi:hypothetical protein